MPEPERDPGLADWHGRTRRPPPARAKVRTRRRQESQGNGLRLAGEPSLG